MGGVAVAVLVLAGMAVAARGYSDAAGDSNAAPDITSVDVAEGTPGVLAITLSGCPSKNKAGSGTGEDGAGGLGTEDGQALTRELDVLRPQKVFAVGF